MDAIEKAIRNAFEKGNADDRAFREKVYRSAFAALDRALQANPGVTVETAIKRRKAMQAKIAEIESEFLPAVAAPPADGAERPAPVPAPAVDPPIAVPSPVAPSVDAPGRPVPAAGRVEPVLEGLPGDRPAPRSPPSEAPPVRLEPTLAGTPSPDDRLDAGIPAPDEPRPRRRRFPLAALLALLVLGAGGYGLWWAAQNGLLRLPDRPQSAATSAGESGLSQSGRAGDERTWIVVFAPNDPTLVEAPPDAAAEVMEDDSGTFLRIRSGPSGAAVRFDVGQGILERLAGKHAVFDIVARAEDGQDTQMAADCDFGALGDCGRRRYAVGREKNEYLFDVRLPDTRPGAAGIIAIDSDFERQGRSVDIYEIKVSVTE